MGPKSKKVVRHVQSILGQEGVSSIAEDELPRVSSLLTGKTDAHDDESNLQAPGD